MAAAAGVTAAGGGRAAGARVRMRVVVMTAALAVAGVVGTGLSAGFVWFVRMAAAVPEAAPQADGIVVLTGGTNRVERGLQLLMQGRAPRLLVSGVSPGITVAMLARQAGIDVAKAAGEGVAGAERVTLGHAAISTHGNAQETAAWAARYGVRSLIVVTAFYHMPRALAELRQALPDVVLHAQPVRPAGRSALLLVKEYVKWLALQLGVPRYAPDRREPAR